jgi:hypothetical protein
MIRRVNAILCDLVRGLWHAVRSMLPARVHFPEPPPLNGACCIVALAGLVTIGLLFAGIIYACFHPEQSIHFPPGW